MNLIVCKFKEPLRRFRGSWGKLQGVIGEPHCTTNIRNNLNEGRRKKGADLTSFGNEWSLRVQAKELREHCTG